MNALQQRLAIDRIIDRVKSPRFSDNQYYAAINEAIQLILDGRTESIKRPKNYSFQSSQMLRDQLQTLIAPALSLVPDGNNQILTPADFYYLILMEATVTDNFTNEQEKNAIRPITYGEQGIFKRNPFKKPKIDKTFFNEISNGFQIFVPDYHTCNTVDFYYLKKPNSVSIGNENNKIGASGALVAGNNYYVYDTAVESGSTYYDGAVFTAASTSLTSGVVIPATVVVNCNMPEYIHDEINRLAAAIMENSLENYLKESSLKTQNQES